MAGAMVLMLKSRHGQISMVTANKILSVMILEEIIGLDSIGVMVTVQVQETNSLEVVGAVMKVLTPNGPT